MQAISAGKGFRRDKDVKKGSKIIVKVARAPECRNFSLFTTPPTPSPKIETKTAAKQASIGKTIVISNAAMPK